MANFSTYVSMNQRNLEFGVDTEVRVCGWRLEKGVYIRGVDVYLGCFLLTLTIAQLRIAMGNMEPTTEAGFDTHPLQLSADISSAGIQIYGRANFRLHVGQFAREGYNVLSVLVGNGSTEMNMVASLEIDNRLRLTKKQLMG